jgi:hypothetical protein
MLLLKTINKNIAVGYFIIFVTYLKVLNFPSLNQPICVWVIDVFLKCVLIEFNIFRV